MGLHIGIIPDGNRRWARQHGLKSWEGHEHGYRAFIRLLTHLPEEISMLTMYALSRENLQRSKQELILLYTLFERTVRTLPQTLREHGLKREEISIHFYGELDLLPERLRSAFQHVEKENPRDPRFTLNLLVIYNGQDEIVHAIRSLLPKVSDVETIRRETVEEALWVRTPADIIIRTGMTDGQRLSGFLLWQSSYAEFYFLTKYWPDFTPEDLTDILKDFHEQRERRFGR